MDISGRDRTAFPDRHRFMGYASRVMRGLIIDYARRRQAQKRGGQFEITSSISDLASAARAGRNLTALVLQNGPNVAPLAPTPAAGLGQGVLAVDRTLGSGYAQQWNVSNLLNTTNLGTPNTVLGAANFGTITTASIRGSCRSR